MVSRAATRREMSTPLKSSSGSAVMTLGNRRPRFGSGKSACGPALRAGTEQAAAAENSGEIPAAAYAVAQQREVRAIESAALDRPSFVTGEPLLWKSTNAIAWSWTCDRRR